MLLSFILAKLWYCCGNNNSTVVGVFEPIIGQHPVIVPEPSTIVLMIGAIILLKLKDR